ncbi:MAG: PAS domain-containing protein [Desulfobacteraceae bacterium]|nr:PAS domain-containing protein [Desulfobacteraceae bacterium]
MSFTVLLIAAAGLLSRWQGKLLPALPPSFPAAAALAILAAAILEALFPADALRQSLTLVSFSCVYLFFVRAWANRYRQSVGNLPAGTIPRQEAAVGTGPDSSPDRQGDEEGSPAEREWERTFDAVPDLIAILGPDRRLRRVNRAMAAKFRLHPREMIGRPCFEYMHRSDRPIANCPFCQVLADGQEHSAEIHDPEEDRNYQINVVPLSNDRGEIEGAVHVARDITSSRRAEQSRRESNERHRILFEQATDLLFLYHLDEEGRPEPFIEVNEATCKTLGYTREEMRQLSLPDLCEPNREGSSFPMAAQLSSGQGGLVTLMLVAKDGMRILVEARGHLAALQGRPVVLSVARDITQRKVLELELQRYQGQLESLVRQKTAQLTEVNESLRNEIQERTEVEKNLRERKQRLRQLSEELNGLLQAIPDTLVLLSPELEILWTNKTAAAGIGPDRRPPQGLSCHQLWGDHDGPCADCPTRRSFRSGLPESSQIRGTGGRAWEVRAFPIKDAAGKAVKVIETAADITEKITLQAEAIRAAHLASIGELAAGVAHEVNNPINGIINYAQLIANKMDRESREYDIARRIIKEGDRIAVIVRSLLSFARAKEEEKKPVHVREVLLDTLTLTEAQLRRDRIHLETRLPREPLVVLANGSQLEQVFLNLINNARYALNQKYPEPHEDKRLEISGEIVQLGGAAHVRLMFHDHGTGIPAGIRGRVMDPFFSDKPGEKGTGLGLSISHGIITDHHGKISIDTVEGESTTFIIDLPAVGKDSHHPPPQTDT